MWYQKIGALPIVLLLLSAPAVASAQSNRDATPNAKDNANSPARFLLEGRLTGLNEPATIYLTYDQPEGQQVQDSTEVISGHFSFSGQLNRPVRASLVLPKAKGRDSRELYLQPGTIELSSDSMLAAAEITGSPATALLDRFTTIRIAFNEQYNALGSRLYYNRGNKDYVAQLKKEQRDNYIKFRDTLTAIIKKFPDSYASWDLVNNFRIGMDPEIISPLFEGLGAKFKNSIQGQQLLSQINYARKIMVGAVAPDFSEPDAYGKEVRLSDYRGKYVLVDFWASWCGICRAENPNVLKGFNAYKNKGFDVLGISLDDSAHKKDWIEAIKQDKMPWRQLSDLKGASNKAAVLYGIKGIPQNVLIDPTGRIIAKNLRGNDLLSRLMGIFDPGYNMRLDGLIDSSNSTQVVFKYTSAKELINDTVNIQEGKFTWLAAMDRPQRVQAVFLPQNERLQFYSDIGFLQFTAKAKDLANYSLNGSQLNWEAEQFHTAFKKLTPEQQDMLNKFTNSKGEQQRQYAQKLADLNSKRYKAAAKKYVLAHPGSLYSLELVKGMAEDPITGPEYKQVYPLFMSLEEVLRNTTTGKEIAALLPIIKRQAIGTNAYNFTQADIEDKKVSMADFKGKYVLLDFWASWCGPCRAENPNVLKAYNRFKSKGFTVVGVSLDADASAWKRAVSADKLPWCQISDLQGRDNEIAKYYGVKGIPWNLLIGPDGRIIAKGLRGDKLLDQLSLLLDN